MQEMLTAKEVAHYLRLSLLTIHRMIKRGELEAVKVGNKWLIGREDLKEFLDIGKESKN